MTPEPLRKRSFVANIFLSPSENRLRAGWRLSGQTMLMMVIGVISALLVVLIPGKINLTSNIKNILIETAMLTGSIFLSRVWLDKRSIASIGLNINRKMIVDLGVGFLIPFVLFSLIFFTELGAGWLSLSQFVWRGQPASTVIISLINLLAFFILVAWNEELLSRGYHLRTVASGSNLFWGMLISSAIFGVLHLANPNAENIWMVSLGIFAAGLFLAYGLIRTGQLWLSIGLHIGWNFFEGPIFGFPVSGTQSFHLLNISVKGPLIATGGNFGPEAGLVVFPVLALGMLFIFVYTRGRAGLLDKHRNIS